MDFIETVRSLLAEREETRRHLDHDIAALRDILSRHGEGTPPTSATRTLVESVIGGAAVHMKAGAAAPAVAVLNGNGVGSHKGEVRSAILSLLQDGRMWKLEEVANRLGKNKNATSAAIRRLVKADLVVSPRYGYYQLPPTERSQLNTGANMLLGGDAPE